MVKAYITYHRLISYSLYLIGRYDFDNSYSFPQICPTMNHAFWVVLSFKPFLWCKVANEILKKYHPNKKLIRSTSFGAVYYAVQGVSTFESVDEILKCDHSSELY